MSGLFDRPEFDNHESVHFCNDVESGLKAVIAIHNSNLGPATGGCRMFPYANDAEAITDVLRLSKGMTYKSAMAGIPLGGGKSVIIGDPRSNKSTKLLSAMGSFIESLNGAYVGAEDSGTSAKDMEIISRNTHYVSGIAKSSTEIGDPSPSTALGVFLGMHEAVKHKLKTDLKGIRIAIQGVGNVGYHLAGMLIKEGAQVIAADNNNDNLERAKNDWGVETCDVNKIYSATAEVFAPCAMGASVNGNSLSNMSASIIAGAANNQLKNKEVLDMLNDKGILYAPDYVINAGGIIDIYYQTQGMADQKLIREHIAKIGTNLRTIFEQAAAINSNTADIADQLAESKFR